MAALVRRYRRTLALPLVVAIATVVVALFALTPTGAASFARAAANSARFTDSTGEDAEGPDISTVVLSNNDKGNLSWVINVPNRPTLTGDMGFVVFINSDSNAATGDPQSLGADYLLQLIGPIGRGPAGVAGVALFRWNGSDFTANGVPQSTLIFSYAKGATIKLNASELGNTRRVQFLVLALTGLVIGPDGELDDTNARYDVAPDPGHGQYTFDVKITRPSLMVKSIGLRPLIPRAGNNLSVSVRFARSDRTPVTSPSVKCRATLGGKRLAASSSKVAGGRATCVWALPETAKGRTIRGTVTMRAQGLKASRTFAAKVT
jgi:hypothetical protein